MQAALADLQTLPLERRIHTRYLWIALDWGKAKDATKPAWAAVSMAVNTSLSRSPFGLTPLDLQNGRLIRLNLADMALSEADAKNLYAVYDSLADIDPTFHLWTLENPTTVYTSADGKKHSGRWVRQVHPDLAPGYEALKAQTLSRAPLLVAEWFVVKSLSQIDGGRYYQFRGLRTLDGKATVNLKEYLRSRGADENAVQKLGSDERAAIIKSGVTAKPRRVDVFRGGGVRPSVGTGLVSITHDISDGQTKAVNDPFQNLLNLESAASEVILEVANGFHEFTLWNAKGEIQDEVPANGDGAIATDSTIPHPHTPRLNPAVSCIRCHGPHDGWQPFANDVQTLTQGNLQVLGDLGASGKAFDHTTLVRLQGLYGGDLAEPLRLGRNTYSDVVFRCTGGMTVSQASDAMAQVWTRYEYTKTGTADALSMMGLTVPEGIDPAKLFQATVPARLIGEDSNIGFLQKGVAIQRRQFERTWPEILSRAIQKGEKQ